MSTVEHQHPSPEDFAPAVSAPEIPPLQNGDRLTREEFERRYEAMPEVKKAELIEGIVYMGSPVSTTFHGQPHAVLGGWLAYYLANTDGLIIADNSTVQLDEENEPQPDLYLAIPCEAGGQGRLQQDNYFAGAPELVCEIAYSSKNIDLHEKKAAYCRNGVREYLVWRTYENNITWYALVDGKYEELPFDEKGIVKSRVFPGLWLDVRAMLEQNVKQAFAAIEVGTQTEEHRQFLAKLVGAAK